MSAGLALAGMELRHQLRGQVFRIVAGVSLLMVMGAAAIDALRIEATSNLGSGAQRIVRVHLVWTLFYLFTAAAFVGDAATRDEQTRFAPLVRAAPKSARTYVLGRFAGAAGAVLLCFLTVPAALVAARFLPGADPAWVTPLEPGPYALALGLLALPNLVMASALFLLLATLTRSLRGCLIGAVALLSLYGLQSGGGSAPFLEPFGFADTAELERGGSLGPLLANRALWLTAAALMVALSVRLHARVPASRARPAAIASPENGPATALKPARTRSGGGVAMQQLGVRLRHHGRETLRSPTFAVLLLLGLASAVASLWPEVQAGAGTRRLLKVLIESFVLVPVVVALFFAGEIQWSDREQRIDAIVGSTPVRPELLLLAQFLALAAVLLALALVTGAAVPLLQAARGQPVDLRLVIGGYVLPKSFDWLLLGVLALALQSLSPKKLAGWGLFVLFLIATLGLDQAGLNAPWLHYGRYPGAPLPPELSGAAGANLHRLIWGVVALALVLWRVRAVRRR